MADSEVFEIDGDLVNIGKLSFNRKDVIGNGSFGHVFKGKFENTTDVAIKRIVKLDVSHFEKDVMPTLESHPNILRFFCVEQDKDFIYIATTLCMATFKDVVEGKYKASADNSLRENLRQIVRGLEHLHKNNIIHRNITPTNILVSFPDAKTGKCLMKLADFGLARIVDGANEHYLTKCGTPGWKAPELCSDQGRKYLNKGKLSFEIDIFPLGILFGYSLSGGKHPFGEGNMRDYRIETKRPMILTLRDLKGNQSSIELIQWMLNPEPKKRPTATQVLEHHFLNELMDYCETTKDWESTESINRFDQLPIKDSIDVNCKNSNDQNPLMLLCQNNRTKSLYYFVQKLLEIKNLDTNARDKRGNNALNLLCQYYTEDNLIDIIIQLVQREIDVRCATNDSQTNALMFCCIQYKHGNLLEVVKFFIDNRIDVNAVNARGESALYLLCEYYNKPNLIDVIRLFIQKGVDLKTTTKTGWNVLHCVCRYYSGVDLIDIIKLFLDNRIRVNSVTNAGWTVLHFLCRYYRGDRLIEMVRLFIQRNADVEKKTVNGDSVLSLLRQHYSRKNFEEIENLITKKQKLDKRDGKGRTSLMLLCLENDKKILDAVTALLKTGNVDVNAVDNEGDSALTLLCQSYRKDDLIDIIKLLLELEADVNAKNKKGKNALHNVTCRYYSGDNLVEIVRLFVDKGIDVNARDNEDWNALHCVLCWNYRRDNLIEIVRLFVDKGIDVTAKTKNNWNALHWLCINYRGANSTEIIRLFVDKGIDVNAKDRNQRNALHLVCRRPYHWPSNLIDIVHVLVEKGININIKDDQGANALHYLCGYEFPRYPDFRAIEYNGDLVQIIRFLVDNGIHVTAQTEDSYQALYLLCFYYNRSDLDEIISLLLEAEISQLDEDTSLVRKSKPLPEYEKEAQIRFSMGKPYHLLGSDLRYENEMQEDMLLDSLKEDKFLLRLFVKHHINLRQNIILLVEKLKDRKLQHKTAVPILNINSDVERSNTQDEESLTGISSAANAAADDHTTDDYINKKRLLHKKESIEGLEKSNKLYRLIIISLSVLIASLCCILLTLRC